MAKVRDELKGMASGFRWGRRPLVPRDAEPFAEDVYDEGFPTDWARSDAGVLARQVILNVGMKTILRSELSLRVYGHDNLANIRGPVIFFSNHSSHLDATLIMSTLPDRWQRKTAVGAARDYFFDVWWRQAFTALVYGAFPIDRGRGGRGAIDKARELVREGWSIVVFPEGTRSTDGHMQRFRHGAARLALELGVSLVPIAIVGAHQAMPKGSWWPRAGRPPVTIRYGRELVTEPGETHQSLSGRMQQEVMALFDEDRTSWYEAQRRAALGQTPSLAGPQAPTWRRHWEGSRPERRHGEPRAWE
jgi:1-acyl-sn-glycerol-3-phosphate acyltransferase